MERILFLDGSPRMKPLELTIGKTVQEMLQGDLALELGAVRDYNAAIQVCVAEKDNGSRDLFVKLLMDEEVHVDWLEAQLHLAKEGGRRRVGRSSRISSAVAPVTPSLRGSAS